MLENISLEALQRTKVNKEFEKGIEEITKSFESDGDIQKKREISLTIIFTPIEGYITTEMAIGVKTPRRTVKSIGALEGSIKIDTYSNDVRQPDLFDEGNVTKIGDKRSKVNGK